ncbi:hypothetical protein B488_12480 [Liberibacter crescens BT-1]|uniref:Uncharacterized protein n=1 Tax=Liberibacter crescens (strain BT-1) TaxID=1215343 RepID=L0EWK8_LIBCB|nr:hypothetical protein B488_12480 [Liberibacter crescens BT-1]
MLIIEKIKNKASKTIYPCSSGNDNISFCYETKTEIKITDQRTDKRLVST